ncbi:uncharacterized protein EAE98_004882 [Botrytis deweyae]|uniref:Chitin-binding type-1 domain-containing protein n=2 Tax=Botrytis TaxID=33196 RepID=A0A4Z1JQU6_9HELO|nr:uncharacterized protein EAE98_004882 [Botrytis deweyae]KAF7930482.1 hypothetical protein EAE98_004882 [Botrytis deweyae]KAF7935624.1 hypothetical protein EAE99_002604 [Botrytis elliptica]TGO73592.1 hypothetical protein BELL_0348g00070 [Botrytis elliptica]
MFSLVFWTLIYGTNASLVVLPSPIPTTTTLKAPIILEKRQATTSGETCGYANGNAMFPRSAAPGYFCGKDAQNSLWGFCSDAVTVADCGLHGYCFDKGACSAGCGVSGLISTTCQPYCFSEFLVSNYQTYTHITCANAPGSAVWLAVPTITSPMPATISSSSRAAVSISTLERTVTVSSSSFATNPKVSTSTPAIISSTMTDDPAATSNTGIAPVSTAYPSSSLPVGAIIGGALGGLSLILLTIIVLVFLKRRHTSTPKVVKREPASELPGTTARSEIFEIYGGQVDRRVDGLRSPNVVRKASSAAFSGIY